MPHVAAASPRVARQLVGGTARHIIAVVGGHGGRYTGEIAGGTGGGGGTKGVGWRYGGRWVVVWGKVGGGTGGGGWRYRGS